MDAGANLPDISSILFATNKSSASHEAFAHALAVALVRRASLTILECKERVRGPAISPAVRRTLAGWGLLSPRAARREVAEKLGLRVVKQPGRGHRLKAVTRYAYEEPTDLVVVSSEPLPGWRRVLRPGRVARICEATPGMTLFVPRDGQGLVSAEDGTLSLQHIVVVLDEVPEPEVPLLRALDAAKAYGDAEVRITRLHVGEPSAPPPDLGAEPDGVWEDRHHEGSAEDAWIAASEEADLLVMSRPARKRLERALPKLACPTLVIPAPTVSTD
ncbi:MAG: universal stress protein [Myxococcota bacterium]